METGKCCNAGEYGAIKLLDFEVSLDIAMDWLICVGSLFSYTIQCCTMYTDTPCVVVIGHLQRWKANCVFTMLQKFCHIESVLMHRNTHILSSIRRTSHSLLVKSALKCSTIHFKYSFSLMRILWNSHICFSGMDCSIYSEAKASNIMDDKMFENIFMT